MCLAIPYKIISQKGENFVIIQQGKKKEISSPLVKVKKGDYVILQNGTVIQKIAKKEANELIGLLK